MKGAPLRPHRAQDLWQTTCSALRDGREPDWQAVADYRRPLLVLLARRFPRLDTQTREDLVHDVLLAIKESLHGKYDSRKGRFRSFLRTVIQNHVLKHLRGRRRELQVPDIEPALSEADSVEVELVAEALGAVRRWLAKAGRLGMPRVVVFSRQVGAGESIPSIAAAEGLPPSTVKRWLREARLWISAELLQRTFELPAGVDLQRLAAVCLRALARPATARVSVLREVADETLRASLADWVQRFSAALAGFVQAAGAEGHEPLWAGLDGFLQGSQQGSEQEP